MIKKIIVDSCVWISAFYKKDKYYEKGKLFLDWLKKQNDIQIIITDNIITETLTFIRRKAKNPSLVNKIIDIFLDDDRIEIYYTPEIVFLKALNIFQRYEKLSMVDSTIIVFYINLNPDYLLSYDETFNSYKELIRYEQPR